MGKNLSFNLTPFFTGSQSCLSNVPSQDNHRFYNKYGSQGCRKMEQPSQPLGSRFPRGSFFGLNIHNFADELSMKPDFDSVKQFALKDEEKLLYVGSVDKIASDGRKLGGR